MLQLAGEIILTSSLDHPGNTDCFQTYIKGEGVITDPIHVLSEIEAD